MTTAAVVQVAHCTRGSSQGGNWGLNTSLLSIPQTHRVHLETRDMFPIHMKAVPCAQATHQATHRVPPQRPLWTSSAVDGALPLGSRQVQVPHSFPPGGSATSLCTQGRPGDPAQSLQDPQLSLLLPALWVSHGFCLTTAGSICLRMLKPLPCPPALPGKGQSLVIMEAWLLLGPW